MYIFGLMVQGVGYYILDCICFVKRSYDGEL